MTENTDNKNEKARIFYERYPTTMNKEFEAYLKENFEFILEFEKFLKFTFKEMDESEEHNTFFELFQEKLIKDTKFHIVNYEDFSTMDQSDKIKEIMNDIKAIVENNLTNNKTNTQAVQNLNIIKEFYQDLRGDIENHKNELSELEEQFSVASNDDLRKALMNSKTFLNKVAKAIGKVRKTQLSFTLEDTQLSELIDSIPEEETEDLSTQKILEVEDQC